MSNVRTDHKEDNALYVIIKYQVAARGLKNIQETLKGIVLNYTSLPFLSIPLAPPMVVTLLNQLKQDPDHSPPMRQAIKDKYFELVRLFLNGLLSQSDTTIMEVFNAIEKPERDKLKNDEYLDPRILNLINPRQQEEKIEKIKSELLELSENSSENEVKKILARLKANEIRTLLISDKRFLDDLPTAIALMVHDVRADKARQEGSTSTLLCMGLGAAGGYWLAWTQWVAAYFATKTCVVSGAVAGGLFARGYTNASSVPNVEQKNGVNVEQKSKIPEVKKP